MLNTPVYIKQQDGKSSAFPVAMSTLTRNSIIAKKMAEIIGLPAGATQDPLVSSKLNKLFIDKKM